MTASVPPGYARDEPRHAVAIDGAMVWATALGSLLLLSAYELVRALPQLYADGSTRRAAELGGVGALVLGFALARRCREPEGLLASALGVTAICVTSDSQLAWTLFPHGALLGRATLALAWLGGLAAGFSTGLAARTVFSVLARLGGLIWLLHPLRAALFALAWLGVTAAFPLLGALRRGGLIAALLTGTALLLPRWASLLGVRARLGARVFGLPALAVVVSAASLLLARERAPVDDLARHGGELAFITDAGRGRHVITRIQDGFALFTNGLLVTTGVDARRYAESLAHPALASVEGRRAVLVLGSTTGGLEREILRWREVERVVSVATDARLSQLSSTNAWLSELGAGALADPRLERVEAEAAVFVLRDTRRYDVLLADLGDPSSYLDGKHFTRFFFEKLRARLTARGVLALPLTSPLRTPSTHASIVRTLRAAGFRVRLYRAPLPTLGEWGFALATAHDRSRAADEPTPRASQFPPGTSFVTAATLAGLFALPADAELPDAPVSQLFDQPVVEAYQREEQALGE